VVALLSLSSFPYIDTLKILQKWGPGCYFFGSGNDADLDILESLLSSPEIPKILALFCEFPSNPLLRSANLKRLRELANRYEFVIIVDETVGNFVNVEILPYADILVSSLTKVFSGETNVMGGRYVVASKNSHLFT
jgi:cystathionine gamma-synthase